MGQPGLVVGEAPNVLGGKVYRTKGPHDSQWYYVYAIEYCGGSTCHGLL